MHGLWQCKCRPHRLLRWSTDQPWEKSIPPARDPGQNAMDRELGKNGCPGGILSGVGGDHHSEDAGVPDGDRDVWDGSGPRRGGRRKSSSLLSTFFLDSSTRTSFHKTISPSSSGSTGFWVWSSFNCFAILRLLMDAVIALFRRVIRVLLASGSLINDNFCESYASN